MAFTCNIRVTPNSGRCVGMLDKSKRLRFFLKSPAQEGKANRELIKTIAKALGIPQDMVEILVGATARTKTIRVNSNHSYAQLLNALGIENQKTLFDE
jgi:uncharacterized protein